MSSCVFCDPAEVDSRALYSDEDVIVIEDKWPAAAHHWLVISRAHIRDVNDLRSYRRPGDGPSGNSGMQLLQKMIHCGHEISRKHNYTSPPIMGFHVPPFISVPHLHLHIIQPPFKSCWSQFKFRASAFSVWFMPAETLLQELQHNIDPIMMV
jgi:diadenosine tetraphosphate (Ap4A) HIT family hydrolase